MPLNTLLIIIIDYIWWHLMGGVVTLPRSEKRPKLFLSPEEKVKGRAGPIKAQECHK